MNFPVPSQRVLQGTAATLTVTLLDADGNPHDAAGTVTVGVKRADGTVVLADGTATTNPGSAGDGTYAVVLTPAQTASLDLLTATWKDGGTNATQQTLAEVVGGFFFSVPEARASDKTLLDTAKYPDADILERRLEVELEAETIIGAAFVPRYRRVVLDGSGTGELGLPDPLVRLVRAVRVYSDPTEYVDLTSAQLAAIAMPADDGVIRRTDFAIFLEGHKNVVVAYEHGHDRPPADLKRASLTRLRHALNAAKSGIPDRATTFTSTDGGTYALATAGTYKTGIPDVDAVYGRYSELYRNDATRPASSAFDFDPQRTSVFHGGRR